MKALPIALSIAGSDSGGGAGIQADLKTFAALGAHGTSVITCLTAQNPKSVLGVQAVSPAFVRQQLEAVFAELPPAAIKTGILFSAPVICEVADYLAELSRTQWPEHPSPRPSPLVRRGERDGVRGVRLPSEPGNARLPTIPIVVDPVMVATSGAMLLKPSARKALLDELFPLATLITPNLDEASVIVGRQLSSVEDLRSAAKEMHNRFGCAVLAKGGHLRGLREAVDIFYDGRQELMLSAPFVKGVSTHGTGCTYSAAIVAGLSHGRSLAVAVKKAKEFVTRAITHHVLAGGHAVLNTQPPRL